MQSRELCVVEDSEYKVTSSAASNAGNSEQQNLFQRAPTASMKNSLQASKILHQLHVSRDSSEPAPESSDPEPNPQLEVTLSEVDYIVRNYNTKIGDRSG